MVINWLAKRQSSFLKVRNYLYPVSKKLCQLVDPVNNVSSTLRTVPWNATCQMNLSTREGWGGSSPELMAAGRRGATRHRETGCVRADAQLSAARDGVVRLSDVMSAVVRCHVSGVELEPSSPNLLTGCLLVVSDKVRNYLYPVFKKMLPVNGCYYTN